LSGLLAAMQQTNDSRRRYRGVYSAVDKIGPEDIQAALDLVNKRKSYEQRFIVPLIVARWAEFDPQAAAADALGMKGGDRWARDSALSSATSEWARKDTTAAKAWALGLPAGKDLQTAVAGVAAGLVQMDAGARLA